MSRRRSVEDMYPLTPMQEGMLFHTLYAPASGVYFQQVSATIRGAVDARLFEHVWQTLLDRHPVLRTAFVWDRRSVPFQVVYREARLPWTEEDWRTVPAAERPGRLETWLAEDRRRGFALDRPPLMRLALLRLDEERYQVVWSHHHLLLDGWSVPLVLGEVFALYDGLRAGAAPRLPARRPYREFVAWVRERAADAEAESFWRRELAGLAGPTCLAQEPPSSTDAGETRMAEHVVRLSADRTARLQQFGRDHGLTINTLVQGAWAIVLSRCSGEDRVVFGSTVSGRPAELAGADQMIGLFINTLPVHVPVPPAAGALAWLADLQARLVALRRFEHTPLVAVQGWSQVPREVPLFESLVVFENYPVDPDQATRASTLVIEHGDSVEKTNYPLTLVVVPGQELILKADYDSRRFSAAAMARIVAHVARVLEGLTRATSGCLADVPWIDDDERHRVVTEWNRTAAPIGPFVHRLFADQAGATPHALAISEAGGGTTFADLAGRVSRLAAGLRERGVGPDVRVAIALPPRADAVVAMLAVLEAGGAYVPIDLSYPPARKRFVVEDSQARLILADGRNDWMPAAVEILTVAAGTAEAPIGDGHPRAETEVTGDNLAYVIYTSGSTGRPKGAMVTHRGLANYVNWAVQAYEVAAGRGAPLHTPLGFDLTVTSVFPPLVAGRPIDLLQVGAGVDALAARLADAPGYSLIKITPAHLEALGHLLAPEQAAGSARALVVGGEALLSDHIRYWRVHAPATRVINEYGPTETVVGCCVHEAAGGPADGPAEGASVPIGRPIANTRLYVLDRAGNPAPVGVAGELHIGGAGVARGYEGRPDLTAERFVPDPFSDEPGARLYRSGDRVVYRADGVLEFLGRVDDQIKLRGFRIEPAEIEAVLRRHPAVADCAVVVQGDGRPHDRGGPRLTAFVVAEGETRDLVVRWREHLARELPAHMMPAAFERLDALPLSVHGKVDRRALAARAPRREDAARVASPPRGATEELVAAIWRDVIGVSQAGRDETFFELGGHSLLATRIVARTRSSLGLDVPLRAIFDAPTIARFAALLERLRREDAATDAAPLVPRPDPGVAPLSFAQQRLWFLHQLDPASAAYNIRYAVRLSGSIDPDRLRASLDAITARHEVLRARFDAVDGRPRQIIEATAAVPLREHDLRGLDDDARHAAIGALLEDEAGRPFDLARAPLLRAALARTGDDDWILALTMHHVVSDAWSTAILIRELAAIYEGQATGVAETLPELPVQYADFAAWQRSLLAGDVRDRHLDYWRTQLADLPVLDLPTDRPRPAVRTFEGRALSFAVPADLATRIEALGRSEGVTTFMTLLAAFSILIGRHAGEEDIAVGTPVASRTRPEVDGLIGFFMNTLVLRTRLGGALSFRGLLAQVRETALAAFAHQDLPFEQLVDHLAPARDLAQNPLFQVMFTTTTDPPLPVDVGGLRMAPVPLETTTAKFDLSLSMARGEAGLSGTFEFSTDLFVPATVERLADHYLVILEHALSNPDVAVDAVPLLTGDERALVVEGFNQTVVQHGDGGQTIVDLFAAQARRTPDAVAVESAEGRLTYAQLDHRSTLAARGLQARGVGTDAIVGLCLERGLDLVVGMYGILKAGGAYLPLDRAYPPERLAFMLRDAGATAVVADAAAADGLPGPCPVLTVADLIAEGDRTPASPRSPATAWGRPHPESLAYVIYTSGSMGVPKGALIPHRALRNHMQWMQRVFPIGAGDRVLQKTPISFDASVWEFHAPLLAGARLVLARPGGHHDVDYLVDAIVQHGVTTLQVVPSLLRMLLDGGGLGRAGSLRRLFCGGEPLTRDLQERLFAILECELHNLYGPTEATIDTVVWTCRRDDPRRVVPIGRPVDNTTAYVIDSRFESVPVGVVGELVIGGAAIGRGYVGQPAATAERFVPDPYGREPGARLYRTGDRVRRLPDGTLEFLGRVDDQIKVRGVRVEPGEIEAVIAAHEAIRETAVVLREGPPGVRRLIAYVAARTGSMVGAAEIRQFVRARLPDAMVPALVVPIDALPRLPNGKIDRRSLPAPVEDVASTTSFLAPRNDVETALATIWGEVLGSSRVGVRDNFFEIGGDSILSLQVVAKARTAGLSLRPADLFLHQTIESLAAVADRPSPAPGPGYRQDPDGQVPLTPIQHWFFERALPSPHHWNQAIMLEARSPVDETTLVRALSLVAASHDVFRLGFRPTPDGWIQAPAAGTPPVAIDRVDLAGVAAADRAAALAAAVDRVQGSIDLGQPPLMRAAIITAGPADPQRLLLVLHHLIVDAVSWRILLEDLGRACEHLERGETPADPPRTLPFAAWASALERHAASEAVQREVAYWLEAGRDMARLPVDQVVAASDNDEASAAWIDRLLDREATDDLILEVPSAYNTQTTEVLLAALAETLAAWTGQRRALIDLEGHGREEIASGVDVSRTLGWFTTLYPVWLTLDEATAVGDVLKAVKEQMRAVPQRGLGYGLLRYLGPDADVRRRLASRPAAEISFNYLGQMQTAAPGDRWQSRADACGTLRANGPRSHLLEIVASVIDARLQVRWIYSRRVHRADTVARLADDYMRAVTRIIDHCASPDAGGYTPSDFGAAAVSQRDLDKLVARLRQ